MEEEYGVKAYVQKILPVRDIINIIGYSLGVNKIYSEDDKRPGFNPDIPIDNKNYAYLSGIDSSNNCSIDFFNDKKGNIYVGLTDPSFLFHGFKLSDEPFLPILTGESMSVTFTERDSLSLELAMRVVNIMGGEVHLDGKKVHSCSNKNAEYPILTKKEVENGLNHVNNSDERFYKEHEIYRKIKAIDSKIIEKIREDYPKLDKATFVSRRVNKYLESSPESKVQIEVKLNRSRR